MKLYRLSLKLMVIVAICAVLRPGPVGAAETPAPGRAMAQQATKERPLWITADHTKHLILQQEFNSGPQVTPACLSCHSEAAAQFHQTIHWTWLDPATAESHVLGKGGLSINNF